MVQKFIHRRYAVPSSSSPHSDANSNMNASIINHAHNNYNNYNTAGEGDASCCTNDGASSAATSIGTSIGTSMSITGLEPTLAEYFKKDVTIARDCNNDTKIKKDDGKNMAENIDSINRKELHSSQNSQMQQKGVCIRVQLWDMNIHQYLNTSINNNNNNTNHHSSASSAHSLHSVSSSSSRHATNNIAPLLPLLKRINGIIIACRCPLPPSSTSFSSVGVCTTTNPSHVNKSKWPEMDALEERIQQWAHFIRDTVSNHAKDISKDGPTAIFVLLTHADQVMAIANSASTNNFVSSDRSDIFLNGSAKGVYSPMEWDQLTKRMHTLCKECGIDSWRAGTCLDSSTVDFGRNSASTNETKDDFTKNCNESNKLPQSQLSQLQNDQQRTKQMVEDMEDAIETTFIDMLSLYLERSRKRKM